MFESYYRFVVAIKDVTSDEGVQRIIICKKNNEKEGEIVLKGDKTDLTELIDLRPKKVKSSQIYLDPNNPRLTEFAVGLEEERVEDDVITDDDIQSELFTRIKNAGLSDITEKIKKVGFLTVDRIVIRPIEGKKGKYVVSEGNRRIVSLKLLKKNKKLKLDPKIIKSMEEFEALVYNGNNKDIAWTLQGLRHISGIKSWGPYQQARFLIDLQNRRKMKVTELSRVAGIGRNKASKLIRSYYGLMQAGEDDDYGDLLSSKDFSIFQEAIFHRTESPLWKWLEWEDKDRRFRNEINLKKLLSLLTSEEGEQSRIKRVNPDLRDKFSKLVDPKYINTLEKFMDGDFDLDEAISKISQEETKIETTEQLVDLDSQLKKMKEISDSIQTLPLPKIKESGKKDEFIEKIEKLISILEIQLKLIKV